MSSILRILRLTVGYRRKQISWKIYRRSGQCLSISDMVPVNCGMGWMGSRNTSLPSSEVGKSCGLKFTLLIYEIIYFGKRHKKTGNIRDLHSMIHINFKVLIMMKTEKKRKKLRPLFITFQINLGFKTSFKNHFSKYSTFPKPYFLPFFTE